MFSLIRRQCCGILNLGKILPPGTPYDPAKHATKRKKDLEYTVDSDLPGVSGSPGLTVPAKQEAEYTLSICPQFGGVFTGSLTFTAPGGLVVWYTVEVRGKHTVNSRLTQRALWECYG